VRRDLLDYSLPPELIATRPADERESARMLVVEPDGLHHKTISDLPELLPAGALVVVNDTRVLKARLLGFKATSGGRVEIFLVRKVGPEQAFVNGKLVLAERWRALGKSSKPMRPGTEIHFDEDNRLICRIEERGPDGLLDVVLFSPVETPLHEALEAIGHIPLPPYIRRDDEEADAARYQTVYAREPGAVAAPTAGLHLTDALLSQMRARGMEIASVTLHVGLGTFQPVTVDDLNDHPMHTEIFRVPEATVSAVARARERNAPVVAIGTTSVRALESAADPDNEGFVRACEEETKLLIQPGYRFRVVDQLFTNFHLPQSTLLSLVAAFSGLPRVLEAYRVAVEERYRFFSYGDAMLLRRMG